MEQKNDSIENSIVDFIEDDEYYYIKKDKQQVENAMWGIYIFAVLVLLFYVFYLLVNHNDFSWLDFILNITVIGIYFCLAAYSNHKPFTAFVIILSVLSIFFLLDIFTQTGSVRGLVLKIILAVYISMRLKAAQKVQAYENKHPKI
jgi:cell division protein FtsW (lipid II flippase)